MGVFFSVARKTRSAGKTEVAAPKAKTAKSAKAAAALERLYGRMKTPSAEAPAASSDAAAAAGAAEPGEPPGEPPVEAEGASLVI